MKLLFDENLSPRLPELLRREFPGSTHARDVGLLGADDGRVWDYARDKDFAIVSKDNVAAREIDDGAVLVNMGSGACFEPNRIGFEIWKALGSGTTMGGICDALGGPYPVDREVLAADVRGLVEVGGWWASAAC